ncbi:hypothetical protein GPA22_10335 [Aromatoleum toluvorans]|uniref:Uncharacterized protein n=1 Tax=Aromatoleum toluvorans TaxID=92002 RepID=A0ABX1PZR3_9RHOO|nr:hypothetical protein [Aromatoleum toluvorans]NMG44127.1 hypothetical protein [Aromatoleum toluvorans]
MSEEKLTIDLNFDSSRGHFLRAIQHQLDIVTLLLAGAAKVSEEECEPQGFHNFSPAHGAALPHEQARSKAVGWLNTCFLRDSIEATDQFLGRCLSFCFAIQIAEKGKATTADLDEIVRVAPQRHHKLHFPAKLQELEKKYGVKPNFTEHVLSLNKLRTCLVHRLGVVSNLDANDDDQLVAKWISSKMVLRGLQTGTELVLTEPGQGLQEEAMLEMHIVEHEKVFPVGSNIILEPYDTYSTIFTLWRFGLACSEAVERFVVSAGVPVRKA